MKNIKAILLSVAILSCLVILVLAFYLYRFNQQITQGLAEKRFLPPTEYYSAPQEFSVLRPITLVKFKEILTKRQYRQRDWTQKLFAGDFSEANVDQCQPSVPASLPPNTQKCILFSVKDTKDPELAESPLQMAAFDSEDKLTATFQGNPLQASARVALEPELFAQYLDGQPVMQNYRALGEIPPACLNAVLAIEDAKFLEHGGFSITGLSRAVVSNLTGGKFRQGGSTITQQLVKNYFLTSEKTLKRKITELFMSILLETHSSKDEILETYLNVIYLGQNGPFQVRGFGAASQYYFDRPMDQLDLADCSLLAAILNSPGLYDPFRKPENALKRRSLVLDRMQDLKMITAAEAIEAKSRPLPFQRKINVTETAPYYIDAVNKELKAMGRDELVGLRIFTGLVLSEQEAAQETVRKSLADLESRNPRIKKLKEKGQNIEGALLSVHNETGLISAMVGGRGYKITQFNRAIDGHRQVGSIMKPIVFLTALLNSSETGRIYDPMTTLNDVKFLHQYQGQSWSPENYDKKFYGQVPMYFALKNSLNAATASLGIEVGLSNVIDTAIKLGIRTELPELPSLTLGAQELYPIEVLQAYLTIARMGSYIGVSPLRGFTDQSGTSLYRRIEIPEQRIEAAPVASLVSMMKQSVLSGSAKWIHQSGFNKPAAGKTGTTSDHKDAWFAGFTPSQTTVVWVGYDSPTTNGLTGASGAVPLWLQFMRSVTEIESSSDFQWPDRDVDLRKVRTEEPETGPTELELVFAKPAQ
jgi:penicillin-binding protein 1B